MRSCACFSCLTLKSISRIGTSPKYCLVHVIPPPRKTLLICLSFQNRSHEFNRPKTKLVFRRLKPVTFHYKSDKRDTPQFGLIAEEVAKVNPDLVVRDKDGQMRTVRYDAVNAMLLNEFLKEHNKVQTLEATVAQQQKGMEVLTAQLKEQAAQI